MAVSTPQEAVQWLSGKVWSKSIPKTEIDEYRSKYHVIATQLAEGRLFIRVIADADPGNGFGLSEPTLEDVYFNAISTKMDLVTL
jgi:hypothetical protein